MGGGQFSGRFSEQFSIQISIQISGAFSVIVSYCFPRFLHACQSRTAGFSICAFAPKYIPKWHSSNMRDNTIEQIENSNYPECMPRKSYANQSKNQTFWRVFCFFRVVFGSARDLSEVWAVKDSLADLCCGGPPKSSVFHGQCINFIFPRKFKWVLGVIIRAPWGQTRPL